MVRAQSGGGTPTFLIALNFADFAGHPISLSVTRPKSRYTIRLIYSQNGRPRQSPQCKDQVASRPELCLLNA